ncbi:uncharacterized protein MCYG_02832 [Microsporum canis CBS 113480]|uniref:Zn(2)-C6 fungal-type domain-containing protein n=1 Tax=Arthroderma otae (strain ATCC MYA-4605 / CBS 113480) TaxID=554155 RepID=C5FJZ1_ARTOC|nr:uncharacterized protein MCYG_02832 [Microsporum canis CBS 113480]EEQ30013.1 predicted protein [Microsporum canis CBS 113480]
MSHQKRTACDRCRAHKLRCVREDPTTGVRDASKCTRCARAGVSCVIGRSTRMSVNEFWVNPMCDDWNQDPLYIGMVDSEDRNHTLFEDLSGESKLKSPAPMLPPSSPTATESPAESHITPTNKRIQVMCALAALVSNLTEHLQSISDGQHSATRFIIGDIQKFLSILDDIPATNRGDGIMPGPTLLIAICYTIIVWILRHACEGLPGHLQQLSGNESGELQAILGLSAPVDNPGLQAALRVQMILYLLNRAENFLNKSHSEQTETSSTASGLLRSIMRLDETKRDVVALRKDMERISRNLGL